MSHRKSRGEPKENIVDVSKWNSAIEDAKALLRKVEARAKRIRTAIGAFKEMRDSGEPWATQGVTPLHPQPENQTSEAATQC